MRRKGSDKKLSDDERLKMARDWSRGIPAEVLATIYHVHPAYVRKAAARLGLRKVA